MSRNPTPIVTQKLDRLYEDARVAGYTVDPIVDGDHYIDIWKGTKDVGLHGVAGGHYDGVQINTLTGTGIAFHLEANGIPQTSATPPDQRVNCRHSDIISSMQTIRFILGLYCPS